MKALRALRTGVGTSGAAIVDVAVPKPAAGEVLVRVHAVSASHLDVRLLAGGLPGGVVPRTMGTDPAGEVVALGPGVDSSLLGTRVAAKPNLVCGRCEACGTGAEADCTAQRILGVNVDGGAASFVAVPARSSFELPAGLDFVGAAAAVHTVPVAMHMLRIVDAGSADLKGRTVLVTGAAGAVGSAAVQVVRAFGGVPIAAIRAPGAAESMRDLGAEAVVDSSTTPLADGIRAIAPDGVDIVVETTGDAELATEAVRLLGWRGRFVTCIGRAGASLRVDQDALYRGRRSLHGSAGSDHIDVVDGLQLVADGEVRPLVGTELPLEKYADGYAALADPLRVGKVVFTVEGWT